MVNRTVKDLPSVERLHEAFQYDPQTGLLIWRAPRSNAVKAGAEAGKQDIHGYKRVRLDGVLLYVHRIAWA